MALLEQGSDIHASKLLEQWVIADTICIFIVHQATCYPRGKTNNNLGLKELLDTVDPLGFIGLPSEWRMHFPEGCKRPIQT